MTTQNRTITNRQSDPSALTLGSIIRVNPRFMRSVHLEADIQALDSSRSFVLTSVAEDSISRIIAGLHKGATQRAWRLTGDYGSGKSEFALALARVLAGNKAQLPRSLQGFVPVKRLQPLAATGDSEPLACTVMRALRVSCPPTSRTPTTERVLAALEEAGAKARRQGYSGILLILDELGKNLEYTARNAHESDIFLLQRMAELASRSADKPICILAILHQSLNAYSSTLDSSTQREWAKVAGRFEEIVFAQSLGQVANLVAASMDVRTDRMPSFLRKTTASLMTEAMSLGFYGNSPTNNLISLSERLFPLHPTTLPVLVRAIRRFGQNERSIFSFLSSAEPMAMQSQSARPVATEGFIRINDIFDYVAANLASTITAGASNTNWTMVEGVLSSADAKNEVEVAVLKTVALLTLLDSSDTPATVSNVLLAIADQDVDSRRETEKAIRALSKRGLLYERGAVKGLCLWPHTSVDLEGAFQRAKQAVDGASDPIKALCTHLGSVPLVPRSHYVCTGTLRYAETRFIPADCLESFLKEQPSLVAKGPDLHLRIVLPLDANQYRKAKTIINSAKLVEGLYVAIASPVESALAAFFDLEAWAWLKANTPELVTDRYARQEVDRQIRRAEDLLRATLSGISDLTTAGREEIRLFHQHGVDEIMPGKSLLTFLSKQCASIYRKAPIIMNELLNRRFPSAAAVGARTKLAEAMAAHSDSAFLGLDSSKRPPEMALYISLIKAGGFHVETSKYWEFCLPPDDVDKNKLKLLPALRYITKLLTSSGPDAMVPVQSLFNELALPPFGIRDGLHPLILALYLATHKQRVAVYEDGTFLRHVGGDQFLRLMKEPQFFHIQYCAVDGVRAEVFAKLLRLLEYTRMALT
jgi:hypothetical protein